MEQSTEEFGGNNHVRNKRNMGKIMNVDSDEFESDEDIDLLTHNKQKKQNHAAKHKRKKIAKKPLRRSVRLKNKRMQLLQRKITQKQHKPREPNYILEASPMECDTINIDNDLYVTQYVQDIMKWYLCCESSADQMNLIKSGYISKSFQKDLNEPMRYILLDWLLNVHRRFKLSDHTYFLAVYILDAYLSSVRIKRDELQLIGCVSMWIASKYHEIYAPEANDFAYISAYSFNVEDIFKAEVKVLVALKFKFANIMTPLNFIHRYLQIATYPIRKKYTARGTAKALKDAEKYVNLLTNLSLYFIELSLFDCKLISTQKPSILAAASLCFAILSISLYPQWPDFLRRHTMYSYKQLQPIINRLNEMRLVSNTKAKSLRKKHPSIEKWLDRLNIKSAICNRDEN